MSPRPLARFVSELLETGQASVTEAASGPLTLHTVEIAAAEKLIALAREASWSFHLVDSADADVGDEDLTQYLPPFHVTIHKEAPQGEVIFVTTKAFADWLGGDVTAGVVRVVEATASFQTEALTVSSCEESAGELGWNEPRRSPTKLVKCIGSCSSLPKDVRPYLLKDTSPTPWGDKAFSAWVQVATSKLMCSLASEVHAETSILEFNGPPRLVLSAAKEASPSRLGTEGFLSLQAATKWIYELDREAETRHRLFSIEFSRSVHSEDDVSTAFRQATSVALEGARIAHSFGLSEMSKDALKAMTDLRKAVTEETAKLSEAMRQLSLSVAGALFYGLALIAAKLASVVNPLLLDAMAAVGALYVGVIVFVNYKHLVQQRDQRARWRDRFYRFLRTDDYQAMVGEPLAKAEESLEWAMCLALGMTSVAFASVIINNHMN